MEEEVVALAVVTSRSSTPETTSTTVRCSALAALVEPLCSATAALAAPALS